ncbi:MAG TPA: zinc ribbon domain-containing protein [Nitrospirae bacterium]|nr:zinc ribbon domain-containing protein [Nitrospirota bacterium]
MPVYEYKCSSCDEHLEVMQKISDPRLTICPECGGELTKLISTTSFVLKGGGWYADGYSSAENGKAKGAEDKKPETKPASPDSPASKDKKSSPKEEKPAKKAAASGA